MSENMVRDWVDKKHTYQCLAMAYKTQRVEQSLLVKFVYLCHYRGLSFCIPCLMEEYTKIHNTRSYLEVFSAAILSYIILPNN